MENLFLLIFVMIGGGAFSRFLYYLIGEPAGETGNPEGGRVNIGRPLSFYGVFILDKFEAFERAENARLGRLFAAWKDRSNFQNVEEADRSAKRKNIQLNRRRRLNPYSPAGCCPVCFYTWAAAGYWLAAFYFLGGFNPFFIMFLIPLTVIIARRID